MTDLDELVQNTKELSSLPEVYIRVSEILDDELSTAEQIGAVVQTDPALASRILKVVNSSFYGFPNEISTISQAISILGRNPLRQLLMGTVLGGVFSRLSNSVFLMDEFWQHSVHTAVIAKLCYAEIVGKIRSDELFIAGLLHDIGKLIIAHQLPDAAMMIQRDIDKNDSNIIDVELNTLGFTHAHVAAKVMHQWGLPSVLEQCALNHHNPKEETEFNQQCWIVAIANSLSQASADELLNGFDAYLGQLGDWKQSGLTLDQIKSAHQASYDQFQMVLDSLGL